MKNLNLAVITVLFSAHAFAEGTPIEIHEAQCLELAAEEVANHLGESGYEYTVKDTDGLATKLKPIEEGEPPFTVTSVMRVDDFEEVYFESDWNGESFYAVFKITDGVCENWAVGTGANE